MIRVIAYEVDFPVTVSVIDLKRFGGLMSSFNMLDSVAKGNPLSSISSSNYKVTGENTYECDATILLGQA